MWSYTRISPEELDMLRAADTDGLDVLVQAIETGRTTVLALADEDHGLTVSALLTDGASYPTPLHAARAALGQALDEVEAKLGRSVA